MYSTKEDVEFYGQLNESKIGASGYDYESSIQKAIQAADALIDEYCYPPRLDGGYLYGFFEPGGVEVSEELYNGTDIVFNFSTPWGSARDLLKLRFRPVLSVSSVEEETSTGTWTERTADSDYVYSSEGILYIQNTPTWTVKNIRVSYKAGYQATPRIISAVSGRLAAMILHNILDSASRSAVRIGDVSSSLPEDTGLWTFTVPDSLKEQLNPYRMKAQFRMF